MTTTVPKLEQRAEQPYVAIRKQVTMQEIGSELPPLMDEVFAWVESEGVKPAGAPFFRYHVLDMDAELDVEVGVPVASTVAGDIAKNSANNGRIRAGAFPAGRYAVLTYTGPYDGLVDAHAALLAWGQENGVVWQTSEDGKRWGARIESYETDPAEEPDPQKYQTELAFLVAG